MKSFFQFVENLDRIQQLRDRQNQKIDSLRKSSNDEKERLDQLRLVQAQNEKRRRVRKKLDAAGIRDSEGDFDDVR
jgi:response regulator of citrate/malate metabolism